MKTYRKLVSVLLLLVFGVVASGSAMAQRSGRSGGYSHGGGVGLGIALGATLLGLAYYSRPAYSYPAYAYPGPAYAYPGPDYTYPGPAYAYPGPAVAPSAGYVEQGYSHALPAPRYDEQGYSQAAPPPAPTQAQPQPQGDWYFCANSNAYYPYVRECAGGWQRVPPTPPR